MAMKCLSLAAAVLTAALAVSLVGGPAVAGLEEAEAAYAAGNFERAAAELRPLAEDGDALAQHNLGVMYQKGIGVAKDRDEAMRWYRRAAEAGVASSQYNLGLMYESGKGAARNPAEARKWFELAAAQGHAKARRRLDSLVARSTAAPAPSTPPPPPSPKPPAAAAPAPRAFAPPALPPAAASESEAPLPAATPPPRPAPPTGSAPTGLARGDSEPAEPTVPRAEETPPATELAAADRTRKGRFGAWLASYRSPTSASKGWSILRRDYPTLFARLAPVIRKADLGPEKGVFYRLHAVPMSTMAEADALCTGYKRLNPNGSCFPVSLE